LQGVGLFLHGTFLIFFAWWLYPLMDRAGRRSFAKEIEQVMPFLVYRYGARRIRDPFAKGNDPCQSYVTFRVTDLILKFSKWRDENHRVVISPSYNPRDTQELVETLTALGRLKEPLPPSADVSWRPYGEILEDGIPALQEALEEQNYPQTKAII